MSQPSSPVIKYRSKSKLNRLAHIKEEQIIKSESDATYSYFYLPNY